MVRSQLVRQPSFQHSPGGRAARLFFLCEVQERGAGRPPSDATAGEHMVTNQAEALGAAKQLRAVKPLATPKTASPRKLTSPGLVLSTLGTFLISSLKMLPFVSRMKGKTNFLALTGAVTFHFSPFLYSILTEGSTAQGCNFLNDSSEISGTHCPTESPQSPSN